MDAVNVDLDEMRARVDATHSIITSRQRVEATMTAEISTMRLDIGDIQEALKNHDSWMEDVSNTLQQMQEKEENLSEDMINLKNAAPSEAFHLWDGRLRDLPIRTISALTKPRQTQELTAKLDTKVDNVAWKEALVPKPLTFFLGFRRICGIEASFRVSVHGLWAPRQANDDLDAAIKTVRDMVSSLRLDVDARRRKVHLSHL